MENLFDITEKLHDIYHKILLNTPEDQLFVIPSSHNNNLFWNIAHVVVTEQLLTYKLSGLTPRLDGDLIKKYSKGTFPEKSVSKGEIEEVANGLLKAPGWIREDYKKGIFKDYNSYTTSAKVTLTCVEDAIAFNLFHLGLHLGTISAIRKKMYSAV